MHCTRLLELSLSILVAVFDSQSKNGLTVASRDTQVFLPRRPAMRRIPSST